MDFRKFVLALAGALCFAAQPAAALEYFVQPTCKSVPRFCRIFDQNTPSPVILRAFQFEPKRRGKAKVSFHGAVTCSNMGAVGGLPTGVSLETQIVLKRNDYPSDLGPSGLFHGATLAGAVLVGGTTWQGSATFNLASWRVIDINRIEPYTVFMKSTIPLNDVACYLSNPAFTVEFEPR